MIDKRNKEVPVICSNNIREVLRHCGYYFYLASIIYIYFFGDNLLVGKEGKQHLQE